MARAIATAELRVLRSRGELRERLRRLGSRLSRPPSLVAAAAAGALAGFAIARRGGLGALARTLGAARSMFATARHRPEREGKMSPMKPSPQMNTLSRALADCGGEAPL